MELISGHAVYLIHACTVYTFAAMPMKILSRGSENVANQQLMVWNQISIGTVWIPAPALLQDDLKKNPRARFQLGLTVKSTKLEHRIRITALD